MASILEQLQQIHIQQEIEAGRMITQSQFFNLAQQIVLTGKAPAGIRRDVVIIPDAEVKDVTKSCSNCKEVVQDSDFRKDIERKEYTISGMCGHCQRKFFSQ